MSLATNDFDVIVVGGGPAGATAAYFLGLRGVKTLLIDKSRFPREKACGGGITSRVLGRFPHLAEPLKTIPVNPIHQVYLEAPDGTPLRQTSGTPLYLMIRRYEFDNLLFDLAREKVETKEGVLIKKIELSSEKATVYTKDNRQYTAKIIIGADGANSVVAKECGLGQKGVREAFAIDMMEETPYKTLNITDRDTMYVYYGIQGHYGYGYIFPKADHINLGVGYKLDYYLSAFKNGHYKHYLKFLEKVKEDRLVGGDSIEDNFMAFPIPIRGPLKKTFRERVLLCGDAAGFVNAFTAEGIYYAMVSGEHAAAAAFSALKNNDFSEHRLREYETLWKNEIGVDLAQSVKIQDYLLASPTRIDRIIKAANKNKKLAELLTRYATGAIGYKEFRRSAMIKILPFYLWHKIKKVFRFGDGRKQGFNKSEAEKTS